MSDEPFFEIVSGSPTPEQLAAIVGVLWARRQAAATATSGIRPPVPVSKWRASAAPRSGRLPAPGRGAWASTH
jgi:acyl-CoA carboxylase epsilon subunit